MIIITSSYLHNHYLDDNKGGDAAITGLVEMLREMIPNARIITNIQLKNQYLVKNHGLEVIPARIFAIKHHSPVTVISSYIDLALAYVWHCTHKLLGKDINFLLKRKKLRAYREADIIIYMVMDNLVDGFGAVDVIEHCKDIWIGFMLDKKTVVYAASIGPVSNYPVRTLLKKTLQKTTAISAREINTINWLKDNNINKPDISLVADPAILLNSDGRELDELDIPEGVSPLIGLIIPDIFHWKAEKSVKKISLAHLLFRTTSFILPELITKKIVNTLLSSKLLSWINNSREQFWADIASIIDYLNSEIGASVLLMTHIDEHSFFSDVRVDVQNIFTMVKKPSCVTLVPSHLSAAAHKELISRCDMVISGKMHAAIAALTKSVPTIAIPYGAKFPGMMQTFGQEDCICAMKSNADLLDMINTVWSHREKVRKDLDAVNQSVREQALEGGSLIRNMINH